MSAKAKLPLFWSCKGGFFALAGFPSPPSFYDNIKPGVWPIKRSLEAPPPEKIIYNLEVFFFFKNGP